MEMKKVLYYILSCIILLCIVKNNSTVDGRKFEYITIRTFY